MGLIIGTICVFFTTPFDKIVIRPELFLPELFFKKILKNFLTLKYFIKKLLFLNRCDGVVGLWILIKMLTFKGVIEIIFIIFTT